MGKGRAAADWTAEIQDWQVVAKLCDRPMPRNRGEVEQVMGPILHRAHLSVRWPASKASVCILRHPHNLFAIRAVAGLPSSGRGCAGRKAHPRSRQRERGGRAHARKCGGNHTLESVLVTVNGSCSSACIFTDLLCDAFGGRCSLQPPHCIVQELHLKQMAVSWGHALQSPAHESSTDVFMACRFPLRPQLRQEGHPLRLLGSLLAVQDRRPSRHPLRSISSFLGQHESTTSWPFVSCPDHLQDSGVERVVATTPLQQRSHGYVCATFCIVAFPLSVTRTFVCGECKSAHQSFSHRCKSVTMSNWNMDEAAACPSAADGETH